MRKIRLRSRRGLICYTFVDDEHYDWLRRHKWYMTSKGYAASRVRVSGVSKRISMHRYILGLHNTRDRDVDHIDRNRLNNQKNNLRIATRSQNLGNQIIQTNNTSGYKGVGFYENRWVATCGGTRVGRYKTLEEAIVAYNTAAISRFGSFARINELPKYR